MLDVDYYIDEGHNYHIKDSKESEDKWRLLFNQYDHDGFGEIPMQLLSSLLEDGVKTGCISEYDVNQILEKIRWSQDIPIEMDYPRATITFQRLTELRTRKRSSSFKCAIHERDGQVLECHNETEGNDKDSTKIDIASKCTKLCNHDFRGCKLVDEVAKEVLTDNTDFKYFNSRFQLNKCHVKGGALFLPIVSLLQVLIFLVQYVFHGESISERLEFRHYSPQEAWRFLSYGMLYSNSARLTLDVGRQLTVGIALELVYGPWRVAVTFVTAVFSASLVVSLFAPTKSLLLRGSSAGANSLVVGLLINWILHKPPSNIMWMKMIALIMFTSLDLGFTIFENEAYEEGSGYIPFSCGLATGTTLGYTVLSTFEQNLKHQRRWWLLIAVEAVMLLTLFVFVLLGKNKRLII